MAPFIYLVVVGLVSTQEDLNAVKTKWQKIKKILMANDGGDSHQREWF